jgi:hypothetical protein
MTTSRKTVIATALLSLCATGFAQTPPPPSQSKTSPPLDLSLLIKAVDTNRDGCMSHLEWQAAGLPESSYQGLKDKSGCVTLARMKSESPPPGIDLNGDGKLTVEEFREFDKKMSAMMKSGKQTPPPAH